MDNQPHYPNYSEQGQRSDPDYSRWGQSVTCASTFVMREITDIRWSETTNPRLWADEWMKVMKEKPELAKNRAAMERLFEAAFDAGRREDWD